MAMAGQGWRRTGGRSAERVLSVLGQASHTCCSLNPQCGNWGKLGWRAEG